MMNLPQFIPFLLIFVHYFWRVSQAMDFGTHIMIAIACDDIEIMEKFLNSDYRQKVLHEALFEVGKDDIELMEPREDLRVRLPWHAALHWAVINESPKVTRLLLENGADVNMLNFRGQTPLSLATATHCVYLNALFEKECNGEVVDTLLEFNPDIHLRDDSGLTPLSCAVEFPNILLVKKLLEHGGNINERCGPGIENWKTPIERAVYLGNVEMTKFLLDNGAKCDVCGRDSENAMHTLFNTGYLIWPRSRGPRGRKDQAAIAKLLLRSEDVGNMLNQRENRYQKTPVDIFFEQPDPNREILVDLLKTLHRLEDAYATTALRTFSPSLVRDSSAWPLDNFPEYVKEAFNSYLEIISYKYSRSTFHPNASAEFYCISPTYDIKYYMENGLYSLYVIVQAHFRIRRRQDRYEKAADEVEKFDEYLSELSAPFQNALSNALAKGTTLEILPTDILTKIFQHSQYGPYIERMTKIMSLVQFTGTHRWYVEEMVDAAPAFMTYVEKRDILIL